MIMRPILLTTAAASMLVGTASIPLGVRADSAQASFAETPQTIAQTSETGEFETWENDGSEYGNPKVVRRQRGGRLAATAEQLGVSEAALRSALGLPEQPLDPDLAGAAAQLETTEDQLRADLRQAHQPGTGLRGISTALATVANQYGVTTEVLLMALDLPTKRPTRPDLAVAAEQLGVSEDELRDALKDNFRPHGTGQRPLMDDEQ